MAELSGKNGKIDVSGVVNAMKSWTCDIVCDALEITDFADGGHRAYIAGLEGWSGAFEGSFNQEATLSVGACTLKLYVDTAHYITGDAIITGIHSATSVDGVVTLSYDFQGSLEPNVTNLVT